MKTFSFLTRSALLLVMGWSCTGEHPQSGNQESVTRTDRPLTRVIQRGEEEPESSAPTPQVARPKRPVVVGGCQEKCEEVQPAFRSYLQAVFTDPTGEAAIPFLETSEMVFNGERKGDRWVQLWEQGKQEKRRAEIAEFSGEFHAWTKGVSADALEVSLANGIRFSEDDGPGFLAYYSPPSPAIREGQKREWTFRLQRRGWEWLVSMIEIREQ